VLEELHILQFSKSSAPGTWLRSTAHCEVSDGYIMAMLLKFWDWKAHRVGLEIMALIRYPSAVIILVYAFHHRAIQGGTGISNTTQVRLVYSRKSGK